jgi:hypothetical protein
MDAANTEEQQDVAYKKNISRKDNNTRSTTVISPEALLELEVVSGS